MVTFSGLGEVAFCECPMHPSSTSLWSPELYVLWVPPIWVAWVLLSVIGLTLVGGLVSMPGPQSGLLPGPALCGDCQPLIGKAGSEGFPGSVG